MSIFEKAIFVLTAWKLETGMHIKRNIQRVCAYDSLKFHFGQNDRYEIHAGSIFISPQFTWTQVKSLLNTEVRFSTEMKSHTGVNSFRLSCERTHSNITRVQGPTCPFFTLRSLFPFRSLWGKFPCRTAKNRLTEINNGSTNPKSCIY